MKDTSTPRPVGRPPKNGRPTGISAPESFVDAVTSWGSASMKLTDRIEGLVVIGLKVAPRHHQPITATYTGPATHMRANLSPEVARKVLQPVRAKRTTITRRMMTLLHYAMLSEGVELALKAAGMLDDGSQDLHRTGTT